MNHKEAMIYCREEMEKGFDDFFIQNILKGRQPMLCDISHRSYPYTDLVRAYSFGLNVGVDILENLIRDGSYRVADKDQTE